MNDTRESRSTSEIKNPSLQTVGEPKLFRVKGLGKMLALLVAAIVAVTTVAATVTLFTHSLEPAYAAVVQDNCGAGGLSAMSLPPSSGTGNVLFGCLAPSGGAALTVRAGGGVVGVWVSNATTSVYLVSVTTVPCTGGIHVLERGNFTFSPGQAGDYWYCLEGVSSPTPWVDVHWYAQQ